MKERFRNFYILCFTSLLVSACVATPKKAPPVEQAVAANPEPQVKTCAAPDTPRPAWADFKSGNARAGEPDLVDYEIAVGHSVPDPVTNLPDFKLARVKAMSILGQTLGVTVSSSQNFITKRAPGGANNESNEEIRIQSEMNLNDVEDRGLWADPESCDAYVRVALKKDTAAELAKLQSAINEYDEAANTDQTLKFRKDRITGARAQISSVRFELIPKKPSREYFVEKFQQLDKEITKQIEGYSTIFMALADSRLDQPQLKKIAVTKVKSGEDYANAGSAPDSDCKNKDSCLSLARNLGAKILVLVKIKSSVKEGNSAGYIGTAEVEAREYRVADGSSTDKPVVLLRAAGFEFYQDDLNWEKILNNLKTR